MPSLLPLPAGSSALWALSVLLALLVIGAAWSGSVANAATMTFAPSFSPSQFLGEGSALEVQFTFTGTEYHGSPDPVTELIVHLPAGVGGTSSGFPTCSEGEAYGEANKYGASCPVGSIAGPVGSVGLDIEEGYSLDGKFISKRVPVTGTIQPVFAEPEGGSVAFYFIAEAPGFEFPVRAWYQADASPYGRELRLEVPLIEDIPGQPFASITSLTLTLGASREEDGQLVSSLTIPQECPGSGKFPWAADVTYTPNGSFTEQTHEHLTAETACPASSGKIVTTTTLQVSPASPHVNEAVTYTATVTPRTLGTSLPSGSITFLDGGQPIAGCAAQALVASAASSTTSCQVSYPAVGTHQITARYGGDSGYFGSEAIGQAITVSAVEPPHEEPKPTEVPTGLKPPLVSCCDEPAQRTVISVAQLKALLARQLTPTGKGAKIGALLKRGGYSETFQAPEAGTLTVQWYDMPRGAKLAKAKAKPILMASGTLVFSGVATGKVMIRLTAQGERLLKHAKHVQLEAKDVFVALDGSGVSARQSFGLGR